MRDVDRTWRRFVVAAGPAVVAVDAVVEHTGSSGDISTVASCDIYEFDGEALMRITRMPSISTFDDDRLPPTICCSRRSSSKGGRDVSGWPERVYVVGSMSSTSAGFAAEGAYTSGISRWTSVTAGSSPSAVGARLPQATMVTSLTGS